jgi:hypothetical protein
MGLHQPELLGDLVLRYVAGAEVSRARATISMATMTSLLRDSWSSEIFCLIPFYLQAVQIHSANGVKLLEA